MIDAHLLHELVLRAAERGPDTPAITLGSSQLAYATLQAQVAAVSGGLLDLGLQRGERVAIYLEKRVETVVASFGVTAAGGVFVPLNPLLKPDQVGYVLRDCEVRVLVTSPERLALLLDTLAQCPSLRCVVVTDAAPMASYGSPSAARGDCAAWADLAYFV